MAEPPAEPRFPIDAIDRPGTLMGPRDTEELVKEVAALLGRRDTRFPGAQPVSFVRRHIDELRERESVHPFPPIKKALRSADCCSGC